jgi:hypothetical protein
MDATTPLRFIMSRLRHAAYPADSAGSAAAVIHNLRKAMAQHTLDHEEIACLRSRFMPIRITVTSFRTVGDNIASSAPYLARYTAVAAYQCDPPQWATRDVEILLFGQLAALALAVVAYETADTTAVRAFDREVRTNGIRKPSNAWPAWISRFGHELSEELATLTKTEPIATTDGTALSLIGTHDLAVRIATKLQALNGTALADP